MKRFPPIARSALAGVCASIAMQVPLIGLLLAFLALPLSFVFPELAKTGEHVEIGFAWIVLKSAFAWIAYIVYYSALYAALASLIRRLRGNSKES